MLLRRYFRVTLEHDLNAAFELWCYIASENGQKRPNFGGFLMSASVGRICVGGCLCRDFSHWQALYRWGRHAAGQVSYFIVQTAVQILIKQSKIALPFRQSCSMIRNLDGHKNGHLGGQKFCCYQNEKDTLDGHLNGQKREKIYVQTDIWQQKNL